MLTNRKFTTKAYGVEYFEAVAQDEKREDAKRKRANAARVRGAMGGTYYE
jgi:hypothetical protein